VSGPTDFAAVVGDLTRVPLRDGAADLVHAERVLQWTDDPATVLEELVRVAATGGWLAVTDTDWGTVTLDHPDADASARLSAAALAWVPHARIARELRTRLAALGLHELLVRHDTATITAWDPDDTAQRDARPDCPSTPSQARTATTEYRSPNARGAAPSEPRSRW
jgi:SAM-dependent methyltransferase